MKQLVWAGAICVGLMSFASAQPPDRGEFEPKVAPAGGAYSTAQGGASMTEGSLSNAIQSNPLFDLIDSDGDGAITMRELRKAAASLKQLDVDKDGKITKDEAMPGPGGRVGDPTAMVDRALANDKDGDGKLTKAELPRHLAHLLGTADMNSDGALDRAELTTALANIQGQSGGGNGAGVAGLGGAQGGFGNGGNFGGGAGDPRPGVDLSQYDRNGDGTLSADEMPMQMRGMLRGADQNGNGQLDAAEVQAVSQRMNERLRGQRPLPPGVSVGPQGVQRNSQ